jgi:hypothetical protein
MLQAGGDPDLLEESLRSERGGELGAQNLERDGPIVPEVVSEVDHGHAAASELALDAIPIGQGGREESGCVGQGGNRRMPFLERRRYRTKADECQPKMPRKVSFCQALRLAPARAP